MKEKKGIFISFFIVLLSILLMILFIGFSEKRDFKKISKVDDIKKLAFEIQDFDWYSRTTTNDIAYNGNHITVNGNTILFNGYGIPAYKDFLFNKHNIEGTKIFNFKISELRTDWHTLEGGGFLFNSKIDNGKLSGYCILYENTQLSLYRLDNIDVNQFHDSQTQTIKNNYGTKIASVAKPTSNAHVLKITATPTKVIVVDNGTQVMAQNLDYSKHVGNGYGPIVSYTAHNCSSLSKIQFEELEVIEQFPVSIYKYDESGKPLKDAKFEIRNSNGVLISTVSSDINGEVKENLPKGTYTYKEIYTPDSFILDTKEYTINVDKDGVATGDLKIYNKFKKVKFVNIDSEDSTKLKGSIIAIYKLINNTKEEIFKGPINEDGTLNLEVENLLKEGSYIYKQIESPNGYILDSTEYKLIISKFNTDGTFTGKITTNLADTSTDGFSDLKEVAIKNNAIKVVLTKVNEINEKLKNAKFEVYNESGAYKQTFTTNENGEIILKKLEEGEYSFKEIEAPNGYILDGTIYKFTVSKDGTVSGTTKVTNKEQLPNVVLPNTGIKTISLIILGFLALIAIYTFIKSKISN